MLNPIIVIGVGIEGRSSLSPQAMAYIRQANQLWGSDRLLALLPEFPAQRVCLSKDISAALETLRTRSDNDRVVLLASGDPGFYGLGSTLLKILPPDEVILIPQVSTLQAAFARVRLSWQDAHFTSAHARPLSEVIGLARRFRKLGILTSPCQTPELIAQKLLAAGIPDCRAVICENLGEEREKITDTQLSTLQGPFADLNVLLLIQSEEWQPAPLLHIRPDNDYAHRSGLITKADIRALCLSRLMLCETDIVWDIGAGSGALSIEMAELAWRGRVFAIEKDSDCLGYIQENVARFGVLNVEIAAGEAPAILQGLPPPNAIFLGGSHGRLNSILETVAQSAVHGCRVAATFAVLENMLQAYNWMRRANWQPGLTQAQMAYGAPIADGTRLTPANPIFIVNGRKP